MEPRESSLPARSWKVIHVDKVIVMASVVGLAMTLNESSSGVSNLSVNVHKIWETDMSGFSSHFIGTVKFMLMAVLFLKSFTKDIYVACYLVMIYSFASGSKSNILPWIIASAVRSLFAEAVSCFAGCLVCAGYNGIRYVCLDYVITKGFSMACSACLWALVYESYAAAASASTPEDRRARRENLVSNVSQARSLESVLAEAVVEWFLEEAERCRTFDSKLAVNEDLARFEEGMAQRAARFLDSDPEELVADLMEKNEGKRTIRTSQNATQTDDLGTLSADAATADEIEGVPFVPEGHTISEFDMEVKNPLRKFPYIPNADDADPYRSSSEELNRDMLGNKSVSVQTLEENAPGRQGPAKSAISDT